MTKLLKAGALWLVIATVVWLITIWRWQSTLHDASPGEIGVQLFMLPVVLTCLLLAMLWAVRRLRQHASAPVQPRAAAPASGPVAEAATGVISDESARAISAWVLAEAASLPAGMDAVSAWGSLQARAVRPSLDAQLQDMDGMPIFTSRVPELDVGEWLDAHAELAQGPVLPDGVLRGLALLEAPLHAMLDALSDLAPLHDGGGAAAEPAAVAASHMKAHLSGVARPVPLSELNAASARMPHLTVRLLLPAQWTGAERDAAVAWVRQQCGAVLDWAQAVSASGVAWSTEPVDHPESLWDEIDSQMLQWSRDPRPALLLVLAVDSAIDEGRIEGMQAIGELFTSAHQTGKVPGEAAAGLLIAHPDWPGLAQHSEPPVRLWRPVKGRRDKSADAAGRVGTTALGAALQQAIALNGADQDRLLVVSDGDHRASRTAELFEALQEVIPGVDPMVSVVRVGDACGELGMARALVPLALACTALRSSEQADQVAWVTHVQSSHERVVLALSPWGDAAIAA